MNIELVSTPWVEKTAESFRSWVRHNKKAFFKFLKLFEVDKDLKDDILINGREKYESDVVNYNEFENYLLFGVRYT